MLRVPLETAGFRYQRFHLFGLDGDHLYAWIEGGPYSGDRPHRSVPLSFCSAEEAAERVGDHVAASAIRAAARSYRSRASRPSTRTTSAPWPAAPETVTALGFRCAGQTSGGDRPGRVPFPTAWLNAGQG